MIRIGIIGYGNLSRGVEAAMRQNPDMELVAVFSRRNPDSVQVKTNGVNVYHVDDIPSFKDKIDVMILGGGSATDLPEQTPKYAEMFNVVDSKKLRPKLRTFMRWNSRRRSATIGRP